ncbi:MAG: hypothetical protein LBI45_05830 [Bacteroidales bacterium]|jgi:hypothetical protein|nr:hypothetical protein [Bacteroidales bacterium]
MKRITFFIALIAICAVAKTQVANDGIPTDEQLRQRLKELSPDFLIGSIIKISEYSTLLAISPDTLRIKRKKTPQLSIDFYLCDIYKGLEQPGKFGGEYYKSVKKNDVTYYANQRGFINANTPRTYLLDSDFLVIRTFITNKGNLIGTTYHNFQLQDIATGEQMLLRIEPGHGYKDNTYWKNSYGATLRYVEFVEKGDQVKQLEQKMRDEQQVKELERKRREFEAKKADGKHILSLTKVEKPSNSQIRFGKTATEEAGTKFSYTDNYINIIWIPTNKEFNFILTNNSPHVSRQHKVHYFDRKVV